MKKVSKIAIVFLLCIIVFEITVQAGFGLNELEAKNRISPGNKETMINLGGTILGTIQKIGIVLSVLMLMIIGIKYMLGSAEEKSEYKKTMVPYVIGAFAVFTGTTIPQIIFELVTGIK